MKTPAAYGGRWYTWVTAKTTLASGTDHYSPVGSVVATATNNEATRAVSGWGVAGARWDEEEYLDEDIGCDALVHIK